MGRGAYQRHADAVRHKVALSGSAKNFVGGQIPRSTLYHWVKNRAAIVDKADAGDRGDLQLPVEAVRALLDCIEPMIDLSEISASQAKDLERIVTDRALIESGAVPKTLLKRIAKVAQRCPVSPSGACLRRHPRQLSAEEVRLMREMVQSPKFSHMPICSVALLARRRGTLSCSIQTWYKYVSKNKWIRPCPKARNQTKKYRGLHAKHPHEYWHLDVTKVRLADGSVQCLQVVLDNRSRAVLSWHISPTVRAEHSSALIKRAKLVASRSSGKCESVHLIVDAGPENIGAHAIPTDAAAKPRVLRRIARREIRHANTMIEVFFKSLKSNYLNHKIIRNVDELRRAVSFYIKQQNEVIPRIALKGLTPHEVLIGVKAEMYSDEQRDRSHAAQISRRLINASMSCHSCHNRAS